MSTTETQTREEALLATGKNMLASVVALGKRLLLDWRRLEDLRAIRAEEGADQMAADDAEEAAELAELEAIAGDSKDEDEARQRVEEDALSVEVRSGWQTPGEDLQPMEACILVCTGGPAARIMCDIEDGELSHPRFQAQDWGTPWLEIPCTGEDLEALEAYCQCFYVGY